MYIQKQNQWANIFALKKQKSSWQKQKPGNVTEVINHLKLLNDSAQKVNPFQEEWVRKYKQKTRKRRRAKEKKARKAADKRARVKVRLTRHFLRIRLMQIRRRRKPKQMLCRRNKGLRSSGGRRKVGRGNDGNVWGVPRRVGKKGVLWLGL
jgi:hypothetical protein